ncbi:MAG: hypothetical protein WHV67_02335, partial [Thermoanaerobaculia bacterium]
LLKMAKEKQKNLLQIESSLIKECEKKLAEEKVKKPLDISKLPQEVVKDKKEEVFSCLCRCEIPAGVWGGYFPDPLPNTSPACEKPGICAAGNWGCYRFYPPIEGTCFDSCTKSSVNGQDLRKEILSFIQKDFDALIKSARKIMEEYLKQPGLDKSSLKKEELIASIFNENLYDYKGIYDLVKESPHLQKIKEKNKRGDPDKALSMVKEAEEIKRKYPYIDASGLINIKIEFGIILAKAALYILPEMEFDEGLYMLDKALGFCGDEKGERVREIKDLKTSFLKWKDAWNVIKNETPVCLDFLKNKKICACEDLYKKKLEPPFNLFNIYIFASRDKWKIFDTSGTPVKIYPKEKIYNELKESMERARKECQNNPLLNTKEYRDLKNYQAYKTYESSSYTDKENLKKYVSSPICDTQALKIGEKILSNLDLCDCHRKEIEEIVKIAKRYVRPLEITFDINPKQINLNERAIIELKIKGGKPPYNNVLKGSLNLNMKNDPSPGFVYNWLPDKPGTHSFDLTVQDSCGEVFQKKISIYVKDQKERKQEEVAEKIKGEKGADIKDTVSIKPEEKKEISKGKEEKTIEKRQETKKEEDKKISAITPEEKPKKEEKDDKEKSLTSPMDLNGKWTVNCGDENMEAKIFQKGEIIEIKIEDSSFKGHIKGNIINLKSSDGKEEISGNVLNDREIKVKVIDREFSPEYTNYCNFKR